MPKKLWLLQPEVRSTTVVTALITVALAFVWTRIPIMAGLGQRSESKPPGLITASLTEDKGGCRVTLTNASYKTYVFSTAESRWLPPGQKLPASYRGAIRERREHWRVIGPNETSSFVLSSGRGKPSLIYQGSFAGQGAPTFEEFYVPNSLPNGLEATRS
jgi:hypothetical protein